MSIDPALLTGRFGGAHEHPFFLPWNRRLRHLQGVSVRNLNVTSATSRPGRSNTDENVEYTANSPTNLLAQSEVKSLHQTRSFSKLASSEKSNGLPVSVGPSNEDQHNTQSGNLPLAPKVRRRSTLSWTGATVETRHKKLQDVARERLTETWFSLHVTKVAEPIYISESVEQSINPNFRFFDLNLNGPHITRVDQVCLKLWLRTDQLKDFVLLIELDACLRSLQFVAKSLENFRQPLPANCILFHFEDGVYTSFTHMLAERLTLHQYHRSFRKTATGKAYVTSSYNALTQLANIDECIQDAVATRAKLEGQINAFLSENKDNMQMLGQKRQADEAVNAVHRARSSELKQIRSLKSKRDGILASIRLRLDTIRSERFTQKETATKQGQREAVQQVERQSRQSQDEIRGQVRRLCGELVLIYPIEPVKNRPLHFCIRNLFLPNSVFDDTNRDEIAAALGFTSNLVHILSLYLSTPLPYPVSSSSSASTIEDPISIAITQRIFPLYPTSVSYKFEYAVFLLNKDIEFLLNKNGLRILDIRHTLPNLKYLLCVLTAGTGELPARSAGGIRGLVTGRRTRTMSRQGSKDSFHSSAGFDPKLADGVTRRRNQPVPVNGKEKSLASNMTGHLLPSPNGKSHIYRNTSLREAY